MKVSCPRIQVVALLFFILASTTTRAFTTPGVPRTSFFQKQPLSPKSLSSELKSSTTAIEDAVTETKEKQPDLPSWDDLQGRLNQVQEAENVNNKPALVTLYRDTNGWCPFCERVWLALEIKQIPYQEQLISLQDKPKWFTQMVPTGLVPAVLFHSDAMDVQAADQEEKEKPAPVRSLVWESLDILKALDEQFPETPRLIRDDLDEYQRARDIVSKTTTAGAQFIYGGRNQTLSEEEKQLKRVAFENALKDLDNFLQGQQGGGFCMGESISGVDIEMVPVMERWRYQLPLTINMTIYDKIKYPHLCQWYDAMDQYAPYTNRVAGDAYSWTAVASTFLRFFATGPNATMSEQTQAAIDRADAAAHALTQTFATSNTYDETAEARLQAAAKLICNHQAVVQDCTNSDPKSQKELPRAQKEAVADLALRAVVQSLMTTETPTLTMDNKADASDAARAVRTVAARMCVPRDMGAPAAQVLRKTLMQVAQSLES